MAFKERPSVVAFLSVLGYDEVALVSNFFSLFCFLSPSHFATEPLPFARLFFRSAHENAVGGKCSQRSRIGAYIFTSALQLQQSPANYEDHKRTD